MPGPYAHITLLHELMRPAVLRSIFSISSACESALKKYFAYCALGAVSPDYPNLAQGDVNAPQWADAMHYTRTCQMISSGIRRTRDSKGTTRDKQISWLLGYCAHVATDMTIHPIVQAKVGPYAENQRQHRVCEMNQDSYIYRRMNLGEIGASDLFAMTTVQCCTDDSNELDFDIVTLWEGMLADIHPELFVANPPDSVSWHREFITRVDECATEEVQLFPLAGNIAAKMKLAYPSYDMVDKQYIEHQMVPSEKPQYLHYDDIFEHAIVSVAAVWKLVERAICNDGSLPLPILEDWNLDNGRNEHGRLVFWE